MWVFPDCGLCSRNGSPTGEIAQTPKWVKSGPVSFRLAKVTYNALQLCLTESGCDAIYIMILMTSSRDIRGGDEFFFINLALCKEFLKYVVQDSNKQYFRIVGINTLVSNDGKSF